MRKCFGRDIVGLTTRILIFTKLLRLGKRSLTDQNYILNLVRKLRKNIKEKSSNMSEKDYSKDKLSDSKINIEESINEENTLDNRNKTFGADNKIYDDNKLGNLY